MYVCIYVYCTVVLQVQKEQGRQFELGERHWRDRHDTAEIVVLNLIPSAHNWHTEWMHTRDGASHVATRFSIGQTT